MMGLLALGSGWESLQGEKQDSGGTKFVQQIGWGMIKMARKMQNWKMGSQVAKTGKTINETMLTDKGCSRTRPGRPLADISGGVSTGDLKRPEKL
jgi:hypothetical protein